MKIVVPFKAVPDLDADWDAGRGSIAKWIINPFDAIAIEESLRMKEHGTALEVVVVTVGPAKVEEQIRVALGMGADRAIRIDDARELDPYAISRILQSVVRRESPDLVIMGKQAIDDDCNQVGQMLAGLLDWPQATFVAEIVLDDSHRRLRCTRETDAGAQVVDIDLPAVVTTDLRLNEPRYVSLPGLIKARRKTIEVLTCAQLDVNVQPLTTVLGTTPQPSRPAGTRVESVEELTARLSDEAKAL